MKAKKLKMNCKQAEVKKKNEKHYKVDAELVQMRFYNPAMTGTVAPGGVRVGQAAPATPFVPPLGRYVPTPPAFQYGAPGYFTSPGGARVYTPPARQPVYTQRRGMAPGAPAVPVTPASPAAPAGPGLFEMLYTMPGLLGPWLNPYR